MELMTVLRFGGLMTLLSGTGLAPQAMAQTGWKPVEQVKTYTITGLSPIELYSSIGERGPKVGDQVRAIAHTDFKLLWTRKYEPQPDGACVLTTARPSLVITYTLPKPTSTLSVDMKAKWDVFIEGIRRHEAVHGQIITAMVREIETLSIGFRAEDDKSCQKIRAALTAKLGEISQRERAQNRDFDKLELGKGGNVHTLILNFVNAR